jgi:hypothetical protein
MMSLFKRKGIKSQSELDEDKEYQTYYDRMKRGGAAVLKGAQTRADWHKMNAASKTTHMRISDAN